MAPVTPLTSEGNRQVFVEYSPTIEYPEDHEELSDAPPIFVQTFNALMDDDGFITRMLVTELFTSVNVIIGVSDVDLLINTVIGTTDTLTLPEAIAVYKEWYHQSQTGMLIASSTTGPTHLVPVKMTSSRRWEQILNIFTLSEASVVSGRKLLFFSVFIIFIVACTISTTTIGVELRDGWREATFDLETNHDILGTAVKFVSESMSNSEHKQMARDLGTMDACFTAIRHGVDDVHDMWMSALGESASALVAPILDSRIELYQEKLSFAADLLVDDSKGLKSVDEAYVVNRYRSHLSKADSFREVFFHCTDAPSSASVGNLLGATLVQSNSSHLFVNDNSTQICRTRQSCGNSKRMIVYQSVPFSRNCSIGVILTLHSLGETAVSRVRDAAMKLSATVSTATGVPTVITYNSTSSLTYVEDLGRRADGSYGLTYMTNWWGIAVHIESAFAPFIPEILEQSPHLAGKELAVDIYTFDGPRLRALSNSSVPVDLLTSIVKANSTDSFRWSNKGEVYSTSFGKLADTDYYMTVSRSINYTQEDLFNVLGQIFEGFKEVDDENELISYVTHSHGAVTWLSLPNCMSCEFLQSRESRESVGVEARVFDGENYRGVTVRGFVGTSANVTLVLLKSHAAILTKINSRLRPLIISSAVLLVAGSVFMFIMVYFMNRQIKHLILRRAQMQARLSKLDGLLENMFPKSIKERILAEGHIIEVIGGMCVSFLDIHSFTPIANTLTSTQLQKLLSYVFNALDTLGGYYGTNKVKTIGDCYFAVSGLPGETTFNDDAIESMFLFVLNALLIFSSDFTHSSEIEEILAIVSRVLIETKAKTQTFSLRAGMASGNVLCGVLPGKVPSFDVWGPVINLAARLEANGVPGSVTVSEVVYKKLESSEFFDKVRLYGPQKIYCKGFGSVKAYVLYHTDLEVPKELRSQLHVDYCVGRHTFTNMPETYQKDRNDSDSGHVSNTIIESLKDRKSLGDRLSVSSSQL